ncbi:MAG: SAM-dependent chlorinase/fluorinase [Candidatus Aminicenantes bacterium]|nr:SAM-dependent chlorinase/fluorinase [Candidatus Aminicenantes bacterium]
MRYPLIALLTDFGEKDFFVASVKGIIFSINPAVRIVDISHEVDSYDISSASFLLYACSSYYPEKTIFLTVVDPGVGSQRKILLAQTKKHFYVGPDNGLLSRVLYEEGVVTLIEVKDDHYFLKSPGQTFEARDKMAPVAAWLSRGIEPEKFGLQAADYKKIDFYLPDLKEDEITGHISYIDKFGNLFTDIKSSELERLWGPEFFMNLELEIKTKKVDRFCHNYSEGKPGQLIALVGSLGTLEITVSKESAARKTGAGIGDRIRVWRIKKHP